MGVYVSLGGASRVPPAHACSKWGGGHLGRMWGSMASEEGGQGRRAEGRGGCY